MNYRLKIVLFSWVFAYISCQQGNKKEPILPPDEFRFRKITLSEKIEDPIDMALDNDGCVYITERKGNLKKYDPISKKTSKIGKLTVDSGSWDGGLKGIVLDPHFDDNQRIYLFYAVLGKNLQRVSRFTLRMGKLDLSSEKKIIEFYADAQRHLGGSLAFDSKGNLYISSGDNTNPMSNAYSPHDERLGHFISDAQRSSANTNDLRGKILRIHPLPNGGYNIPKGNLFPGGSSLAKPEIYIMGCRNAFKATVDTSTDVLYWGEVGPDAGVDSEYGPKGYDEINRATKPGNYGWPYFVADNKPYYKVNFSTQEVGNLFNKDQPINSSTNNTGLETLPSATPAWIWYPYDLSKEYKVLGVGGRTALAGPVYHFRHTRSNARFPKWFDNKLFIFDWMRNWIMTVETNEKVDNTKIVPFMPSTFFNKPIDMEFGPDGCLYILEYGSNWVDNMDSRLSKIEYISGNRAPIVNVSAKNDVGSTPLKTVFSSKGTIDYDVNDKLKYEWSFTNESIQSTEPNPEYTFTAPGMYKVRLNVSDDKGKSSYKDIAVKVGNSKPVLSIEGIEPYAFYYKHDQLKYSISVSDKEDKTIDTSWLKVKLFYDPDGMIDVDKEPIDTIPVGLRYISVSDCKGCHSLNKQSTGPSFQMIANRYHGDLSKAKSLSEKIIKGGGGIWGENHMSAHPQLSIEKASVMVRYILSLNISLVKTLPQEGIININNVNSENGTYKLEATYTDKGTSKTDPLTTTKVLILKSPLLKARNYTEVKDHFELDDQVFLVFPGSYIMFKDINLNNIKDIIITFDYGDFPANSRLQIFMDKPDGRIIGSAEIPQKKQGSTPNLLKMLFEKQAGVHTLYFVYALNPKINTALSIKSISFERK